MSFAVGDKVWVDHHDALKNAITFEGVIARVGDLPGFWWVDGWSVLLHLEEKQLRPHG